jgi:hypothetical protein
MPKRAPSRNDALLKLRVRVGSAEIDFEGREAFLESELPRVLDLVTHSHNAQVKAALIQDIDALQVEQAEMDASHAKSASLEEESTRRLNDFNQQLSDFLALVAQVGAGQTQLLDATRQMQETQMSFNLQYLQLQSQMQDENRQYSAVSNIMKTKHDTVKNSISNIR